MFKAIACALTFASAAHACDVPICTVPPEELNFTKLIDFDDVLASIGVGSRIDEVIVRGGATIGERFAGQTRVAQGDYDVITGTPFVPLQVIDGGPGQTLGAMHLLGTIVLHGHGPASFPRVEAVGEGALAVLFDRDQPALSFDIRGGEQGHATVHFIRRDGTAISSVTLGPLGEQSFGFHRKGMEPDIAGFVLSNTDPQGVAIDNLRFESNDVIG